MFVQSDELRWTESRDRSDIGDEYSLCHVAADPKMVSSIGSLDPPFAVSICFRQISCVASQLLHDDMDIMSRPNDSFPTCTKNAFNFHCPPAESEMMRGLPELRRLCGAYRTYGTASRKVYAFRDPLPGRSFFFLRKTNNVNVLDMRIYEHEQRWRWQSHADSKQSLAMSRVFTRIAFRAI